MKKIFILVAIVAVIGFAFMQCTPEQREHLNPLDPEYTGTGSSGSSSGGSDDDGGTTPTYHTGVISFNSSSYTGTNTSATITLTDADLTASTVNVNVKSSSDATGITVTLNKGTSSYTGTVDFTTGASGSGKIRVANGDTVTVSYSDANPSGIRTDTATWSSNSSNTPLIIYSDAGLGTGINAPLKYNGGGANSDLSELAGGCSVDSSKSWRYSYTNAAGGWSGWYCEFSSVQDISSYTYLKLYIKGETGGEQVEIFIEDTNHSPTKKIVTATTNWQEVSIPLTDFEEDLTIISIPYNIAFSDTVTKSNVVVYVDYIRFEK